MAPHMDAAQHLLIKTLLMRGFETKLIASAVSCSVRAVQRIRLKRQQFEMPTPSTNRVGRRTVACKIGFLLLHFKKILSTNHVSQFRR